MCFEFAYKDIVYMFEKHFHSRAVRRAALIKNDFIQLTSVEWLMHFSLSHMEYNVSPPVLFPFEGVL